MREEMRKRKKEEKGSRSQEKRVRREELKGMT